MKPNDAAIRKRTQIAKANRTMFLWIAVASALIGAALVVSIFMFQKLMYNEKVLGVKQNTVSTLDSNNATVSSLEDQIRVLDTNAALGSIKANPNDQAIQVILDALPSDANSFALGASLQNKLLAGIDGLSIESLQVDPVVGVETLTGGDTASTTASATDNSITFQFAVRGNDTALKQVLTNLERSIRTIQVTSVRIEIKGDGPLMTVSGKAFYEPAKTIELQDKVVKP
ncbi:MAG TPA: hypothetical protein VN081_06225 [Dongiaceae bacterium]|nr:hypothetical protein [Dongiaceae bacterium]